MRWSLIVVVWTLVGCGDSESSPDAAPLDAPVDAAVRLCSAGAETVLDATPRRISSIAAAGDRVVIEAHMVDVSGVGIGGEVLALDPGTLANTSLRS